jgi:ABC-2 type transport system permease protein
MRRVWGLTKKELRSYFNSPIAYIVIGVLLVGIGYFFFGTFFLGGQTTLRPFFRFAGWSFLLFAPAITMRSFAEERKTGTLESLLTLPVKEWEAVAGKFLAGWVVMGAYLLLTVAYPISIARLGDLDWGPVIGGYVGLLLLGGVYLSIGAFASSFSRNQVVSLIVAFVICLALYWLDLVLTLLPPSLANVLGFIAVDTHFQNIARGVLDSRDLFYYASLTGLFLFLAAQVLESRMTDHSAVRRINKPLYIAAALGIAVALNVASQQSRCISRPRWGSRSR